MTHCCYPTADKKRTEAAHDDSDDSDRPKKKAPAKPKKPAANGKGKR